MNPALCDCLAIAGALRDCPAHGEFATASARLALETDRIRAIEQRENANAVSVRVELENNELKRAARDVVADYMAGADLGPAVARLEDLTGGQQSGV